MNALKTAEYKTSFEVSQPPLTYLSYEIPKQSTKLHIKHMVSLQCRLIVKEEMEKLGLPYIAIGLGTVEILDDITEKQREQLKESLFRSGLELIENKKNIIIEKIKNVIIEMIHYMEDFPNINYSEYISEKLHYDYTYLSNIFSKVKGITIQQFIIIHKIERIKELLLHDNLNLKEISYKLRYSSVGHLSHQFKKITGISPTTYKKLACPCPLYIQL